MIKPRDLKLPREEHTLTGPLCEIHADDPDVSHLALVDFALNQDDVPLLLTYDSDSLLTRCGDGGWSHHFPGNRRLNAMALMPDGSTVLGGKIADVCLLTKIGADGTEAWTKSIGETGKNRCEISSVGSDAAGNVYVAAVVHDALPGETGAGTSYLLALVAKYDATGNQLWIWHPQLPTPRDNWGATANFDPIPTLATDPSGGVVVTLNAALVRLDAGGAETWRSAVQPSMLLSPSPTVTEDGQIYVAWGPYLMKVDTDGEILDLVRYVVSQEITDAEGTTWKAELKNSSLNRSGVVIAGDTIIFHGIVTNQWSYGAALPTHDALLVGKFSRDLTEGGAYQVIAGPSKVIGLLGAPIIRIDTHGKPILAAFHTPGSTLALGGLVSVLRVE